MVRVECYAGYKPDERPLRFFRDGREYVVESVLKRWASPGFEAFRVRTPQGHYELRHNLIDDSWTADPWRPSTS